MYIIRHVPSRGTLRRVLKQAVFGKRVMCPKCQSRSIQKIVSEERWRCRRCRKPFSIKSASWLKGAKLPLETIWLLLWCYQKELPLKQTAALCEVSYPTIFLWYEKFRNHIPAWRIEHVLKNKVVCDELFTRDNCIMGAKEKGTRNIAMQVLHKSHPDRHDAVLFLARYVRPESELATDGSSIYHGIEKWYPVTHTYERHAKWEFSKTAEGEGLWGVFRTFVRRMYHHVTNLKLAALVTEFCLRFGHDEVFNSPEDYWNICLSMKPFAL